LTTAAAGRAAGQTSSTSTTPGTARIADAMVGEMR
jgi:hypothetical protein